MSSPLAEGLPYRPCVGMVVFNEKGKVWMGHRVPQPRGALRKPDDALCWQLPQGGIDMGEDPLAAAKRELWEETGIVAGEPLARTTDWLIYDLPDELVGVALKGKYRGQKQMWFAFRFDGDESAINISNPPDSAPVEFDAWEWVDLADIADRIVLFKRDIYTELMRQFAHLPEAVRASG